MQKTANSKPHRAQGESSAPAPAVSGPRVGESSKGGKLSPEEFQAISRALADPRRFEILQQIAANENLLCGHLHAQECISPATISHHLKELQEAGLIEVERSGRQMCLRLRRSAWAAYLQQLQQL